MNAARKIWLDLMLKIASPVIESAAAGRLKTDMPVEQIENCGRENFSHLEALGRTVMGIAPWLECNALDGEEEVLRHDFAEKTRLAIGKSVDPGSEGFLNFSQDYQPIVDAAFLAQGILRAKNELWEKLDTAAKANLIAAMRATRTRKPCYNNWLLFSAIIEAFLYFATGDFDPMRVDCALRRLDGWYVGEGLYSDGEKFAVDYYNSYVINPMMVDIVDAVGNAHRDFRSMRDELHSRALKCSELLLKLIAPDGSYPVLGRSSAYRFGAFHCLAQSALAQEIDSPARVREAMTAVFKRTMAYENFDENGWLKIGVCGSQPQIGEGYISTGSLYLCCAAFLPLGLAPSAEFWSGEAQKWPSAKMWR